MSTSSVKLFQAWAACHHRVIALEDRLKAAQDGSDGDVETLTRELAAARAQAEQALRVATESFHAELRARGLE